MPRECLERVRRSRHVGAPDGAGRLRRLGRRGQLGWSVATSPAAVAQPGREIAERRAIGNEGLVARQLLGERSRRSPPARFARARAIISTSAASPNSASSSFWFRNAVAAATPTSAPVIPPVCANVASITADARRVHPDRRALRQELLLAAGLLDVLGDAADPAVEALAERGVEVRSGGPEARRRRRRGRASTRSSLQAVAVRRAASPAWDRASAVRSASVSSRTSATGARGVRPSIADSVPRSLPMPLEKNRVISSAPTNACHWRSASARRNVPLERSLAQRRWSSVSKACAANAPQRVGLDGLVLEVVRDALDERREAGEASGKRPGRERAPCVPIRAQRIDPLPDRGDGVARRAHRSAGPARPPGSTRAPRPRPAMPASASSRAMSSRTVGAIGGVGRHPVDHDQQRQPAVARAAEHLPRDAVGVARRRRHEDRRGRRPRPVDR